LTRAIDFSASALLKLAVRVLQSEAEAGAVKSKVAESKIGSRLDTASILGFSIKQSQLDGIDDKAKQRLGAGAPQDRK
jgi:hypothetical protein